MIEIRSRFDGALLQTVEADSLFEANLRGANLFGADLREADLREANLFGADLREADLGGANLRGADLGGADLRGANGARAPIVPEIDAAILAAITEGGRLDMSTWHACNTTHCRAGWAVHLAGPAGYALEDRIGANAAGALIYAASRPGMRVPDFFCSNHEALADLRKCSGGQTVAAPATTDPPEYSDPVD